MSRSEPIEKIRKRFRREWLLIAVDKMDEATTTPLTGRLLLHSPIGMKSMGNFERNTGVFS